MCRFTVWDPYECLKTSCGTLFCKKCILNWQKQSEKCPNCSDAQGFRQMSRILRN
ncbi:MAG: RING finger domain-containing protein [Flammeovirgaceae bacterium]